MTFLQRASQDLGISLRQLRRHAMAGRVPGIQFTKGGHLRMRGPWTPSRLLRLKESLPLRTKRNQGESKPSASDAINPKNGFKELRLECVRQARLDPAVKAMEKKILLNSWTQTREQSKADLVAYELLLSKTAKKIKASKMAELRSTRGKSKVRPGL